MAKNVVVNVQVNSNIDETTKKVQALGTEVSKSASEIGKSSGILGSLDKLTGGLASSFTGLISGIKGATSGMYGLAGGIAATGIGLLVPLVALLVDYFRTFDPVLDKIEQGMAALGAGVRVVEQALVKLFSLDFSGFATLGDDVSKAADAAIELTAAQQELQDAQASQVVTNAKASAQISELILKSKDRTKTEKERIAFLEQAQKIEEDNFKLKQALAEKELKFAIEAARIKGNLSQQELDNLNRNTVAYANYLLNSGKITQKEFDAIKDAELGKIKIREESVAIQEKTQTKQNALADAAAEKEKKRIKKSNQDGEKLRQDRIADEAAYQKTLNDQKIALMEEGLDKELAKNKVNHDIRVADIEKLDNISKAKRQELLDNELKLYEANNAKVTKAEKDKQDKINQISIDGATARANDALAFQEEIALNESEKFDLRVQQIAKEEKDAQDKLERDKELYKEGTEARAKAEEDYANGKQERDQKLIQNELDNNARLDEIRFANLQKKADDETLSFEDRFAALQEQQAAIVASTTLSEEERTAALEANTQARIKLGELEQQKKAQQLAAGANVLKQASELLGEATAAGKAAAIAAATINTYQAATAAYASLAGIPIVGPALGAVAAGVAIAAGIANVKKILAVKTPGKDTGSSSSIDSGSAASAAATPIVPQQTVLSGQGNQLNNITSAKNVQGTQAPIIVQASISESEVTETQQRIKNIQNNSELGG